VRNLRVTVNNAADQTEARNIMISLGYLPKEITCISGGDLGFVVNAYNENGATYKEITLPELRDLVVLKRNYVGDATHTDGHYNFYVGKDKNYFFSSCDKAWRDTWKNVEILKPIEKKEMKEYLDKQQDGTYKLIEADSGCVDRDWIEIPEGSETFNYYDRKDNLFFLKGTGDNALFSNDINDWEWKEWGDIDFDGVVCLWSRHTHPEELPFVDDETSQSLNDQYAEIEKVRKKTRENNHYFIDVSNVDEVDFYEIAKRYNVTDPAIQHILKKCLAIGNRGHKDLETDLMDILKTAKRALRINGFGEPK
jgi:hypothetical protein